MVLKPVSEWEVAAIFSHYAGEVAPGVTIINLILSFMRSNMSFEEFLKVFNSTW